MRAARQPRCLPLMRHLAGAARLSALPRIPMWAFPMPVQYMVRMIPILRAPCHSTNLLHALCDNVVVLPDAGGIWRS